MKLNMKLLFNYNRRKGFATATDGKSLLWEITGKHLIEPSYFFGTMHMMCAEDVELSINLKEVIRRTSQVYFEVDITNASEIFAGILEKRVQSGLTLKTVLSPDEYEELKSFFDLYKPSLPFSVIETQPPLMITSSIYELLMPCEQKDGLELKIFQEVRNEQKAVFGLESIAFQASVFDTIPYEEQARDLLKTINSLEKNRDLLHKMIEVYKQQDIETLFSLSTNDVSITGNYLDLLLFDRNGRWVNEFYNIARNTSTLFAVGAGHLGGQKGVLSLLRQQGYTVRPIEN